MLRDNATLPMTRWEEVQRSFAITGDLNGRPRVLTLFLKAVLLSYE